MQPKGYVFRDNQHFGPLSPEEIKELISRGLINTSHHYWQAGYSKWVPLKEIETFRAYESLPQRAVDDFQFKREIGLDTRYSWLRETGEVTGVLSFDKEQTIASIQESSENHSILKPEQLLEQPSKPQSWQRSVYFPMLLAVALVGAAVGVYFKFFYVNHFQYLNSADEYEARKIIGKPLDFNTATAKVFLSNSQSQVQQLLVATNLSDGSTVKLKVIGLEGSLINSYEFESQTLLSPVNGIAIIPIQKVGNSLGELPKGKYQLDLYCIKCAMFVSDKPISSQRLLLLGDMKMHEYDEELLKFQDRTREQANIELIELSQIITALKMQNETYPPIYPKKSKRRVVEWERLQSEIMVAFNELSDEKFLATLFYKKLYLILWEVGKKISSANQLKVSNVNSFRSDIEKELNLIQRKLDKMKSNFFSSKGYPERKGL